MEYQNPVSLSGHRLKSFPQKIPGAVRLDGTSLYRPINFEHKIVRCTNPTTAWFNPATNKMMFSGSGETQGWKPVKMNCGGCIWCRRQRTREWAVRCMHEAKFHERKCFLTLTYNDEHLPHTETGLPTLRKEDLQKFLKRLRKRLERYDVKVRYFACGEYGERFSRPHYHLIVYGWDFPDKTLFKASRSASMHLYRSRELEILWPFGHSTIGGVTYESAAYVASYCAKKINGKNADEYYLGRVPEFVTMSKGRPYIDKTTGEYTSPKGIGYAFVENYENDVYNTDRVILRDGVTVGVPRYYDKLLRKLNPARYDAIKAARVARAESQPPLTYEMGQLERVEAARKLLLSSLNRSYEKCPTPQPQLKLSSLSATQQLDKILRQEFLALQAKPSRGSHRMSLASSGLALSSTKSEK